MIRSFFRPSSLAVTIATCALTALALGCAGADRPNDAPEEAPIGTTSSAIAPFNPCHPEWQLPTWARGYYTNDDPVFQEFENILEEGGARWIGSFGLPDPFRAIVRVDTFRNDKKTDPHKALWFLAAIPAGSYRAIDAIKEFANLPPVSSRLLGFCSTDQVFYPDAGTGTSPPIAISQYIVEYDPRCTCSESHTASMAVWVSPGTYSSMPTPRY
jgi:hypothetical protein